MTTSARVPADDPRMIAWTAYKATEEYANSFKWAVGRSVPTDPRAAEDRRTHVEGSLWAAFIEGFEAGARLPR